jgi:excisionase family DNA binding protein
MPDKVAQKLDKAAERFGVSKRDLLATLVSDHLDIEGDELVFRPHGRGDGPSRPTRPGDFWRKRPDGAEAKGAEAEGAAKDTGSAGPWVRMTKPDAPAAEPKAPAGEVLTLEEAAELLRVSVDDVRALVESGELPGRRIGATWRLTRTALLAWLADPSPAAKEPPVGHDAPTVQEGPAQ